ncbi:uncharacterized protein ISCGN_026896 [Ixodes scapularis]
MSSRGASATAFTGRGSSAEMSQDTYRVVLPSLPTGTEVLNSVFAHCDITGRPYKIDDFRGEMERHGVLNDLIGAGAYQMNHVWLFTFNSLTAKRKILEAKELVVKEKRCLLIDPDECEVRIRLHWIPIHISDDTVRRALEPYGKINEVSRDTWRAEGFQNVQTTTRLVRMNLKEGVTKENLPHQLRLFGSNVLVLVPGRAPLCLRCKRTGHIRRECRVPRCDKCHRFGHEQEDCIRTYATVMRPAPEEDNSEFFIDEFEASKIEDGSGHPTTTHTQAPSGADKRDASQDEDTTATILEADKTAACVGNGTDIVKAAPGSSKSQRQKTVDGNDLSFDDATEVDSEMGDSSDPSKRPLDRVEEEDPDLEGPDWSKPQGRKKRKPRAPPDGQREQTSQ